MDRKHVWHPFTQMLGWRDESFPVITRGEAFHLMDSDGRRYIDGVSSLWCNVHGHRVGRIDRAIIGQLGRMAHSTMLGLSNEPAIELAERLVKIAPKGIRKVFYSDSGSEAVEVALKMAYQFWSQSPLRSSKKRDTFLTLKEGYHGDTIGSVSLGSIDAFHAVFGGLLFPTVTARHPYCYRCPFGLEQPGCSMRCLEEARALIRKNASRLAGVVMEPLVQGAGGMITQPKGFLKGVADECRKAGTLLILDEVATGFGRTGRMFACEHEEVRPDILCVAKGLTGGYLPLSATLTTDEIYNGFLEKNSKMKAFFHGHTYTGNPLACAAALASLNLFDDDKIIQKMAPKIAQAAGALSHMKKMRIVGDIRQCGLMIGIELVKDRKTREPFPAGERIGHQVTLEARKRGAIIRPLGGVVVLMPAPAMGVGVLGKLMAVTAGSINAVAKTRGLE